MRVFPVQLQARGVVHPRQSRAVQNLPVRTRSRVADARQHDAQIVERRRRGRQRESQVVQQHDDGRADPQPVRARQRRVPERAVLEALREREQHRVRHPVRLLSDGVWRGLQLARGRARAYRRQHAFRLREEQRAQARHLFRQKQWSGKHPAAGSEERVQELVPRCTHEVQKVDRRVAKTGADVRLEDTYAGEPRQARFGTGTQDVSHCAGGKEDVAQYVLLWLGRGRRWPEDKLESSCVLEDRSIRVGRTKGGIYCAACKNSALKARYLTWLQSL